MINHTEILRNVKRMKQIIKGLEYKFTFEGRMRSVRKARKIYYSVVEALSEDGTHESLHYKDKLAIINSMLVAYAAMAQMSDNSHELYSTYRTPNEIETYLSIHLDIIKYKITDWITSYIG